MGVKHNQINPRKLAEEIFNAGFRSVLPSVLVPSHVKIRDNSLLVGNLDLPLSGIRNIYVIGAGKASALMAAETEKILGNRIKEGHVIVKYGHSCPLEYIKVTEAGHPVPDSNGFRATKDILKIASAAGSQDLILCLISGGGSALLADHPEGCTPADIAEMNDLLVNCGATISEINAVRKHLSLVKGGQLAVAASPATLISLILSDVPGDPPGVIASGPTVPDTTTFTDALDVLERYGLKKIAPGSVLRYLEEGRSGLHPDTPEKGDEVFMKTHNLIIGNNSLALQAARQRAFELNIDALIMDTCLQGDASDVAGHIVQTALKLQAGKKDDSPVCLLFGGETTVKMSGNGMGGRNQHLALLAAAHLRDHPDITLLSGGTDGNDGPTDAAGAVVDSDTYIYSMSQGLNPEKYIRNFDSWSFFRQAGGHIITGPTMTNVMDIIVVIVK